MFLGGDDVLGLSKQEIGVAGLIGVGRPAVLERFEPLADRCGVVLDLPAREVPVHGWRHVFPALQHGPDLETVTERGRRVRAGLDAVQYGAARGALEALWLDVLVASRLVVTLA